MNISEQLIADIVRRVMDELESVPGAGAAPKIAAAARSNAPDTPVRMSALPDMEPPLTTADRPDVSARANAAEPFWKHVDPSGVLCVRAPAVKPDPFDTGKPGDKVFLKDVVTLAESPRLGAGVMGMDHSGFDWTLRYDEWDYVIEGTLEIAIDGRRVVGNAGDMIFIPANSSITFCCPTKCRFAYFVYPADWSNQ